MNEVHELLKVQGFIAELTIDQSLFDEFLLRPEVTCRKHGLNDSSSIAMAKLDVEQFSKFRQIIIGTRAARFSQIFQKTITSISGGEWAELTSTFMREKVIREASENQDAYEFISWVNRRYPKSLLGSLMRFDMALFNLAEAAAVTKAPSKGTYVRAKEVDSLSLDYRIEQLNPISPLQDPYAQSSQDTSFYYLLQQGAENLRDIEIFEVNELVFRVMETLRQAITIEELSCLAAISIADAKQLVKELSSAAFICKKLR